MHASEPLAARVTQDTDVCWELAALLEGARVLSLPNLGEYDAINSIVPGRREPDRRARSSDGAPEHGQVEPVVVQHRGVGLVVIDLEAVHWHSLLGPATTLDPHIARCDVPAAFVEGHAKRLAPACPG